MDVSPPRLAPPSWLRWPRRTARLRLTALCGGLFLVSGVALVAVTYPFPSVIRWPRRSRSWVTRSRSWHRRALGWC